ncbi:MAG: LamG domain-containing protein, partial [Candidatus Aenigmatarchaeota archaeon]
YFDKEKNSLVFYYNSPQKVDLLGKIGDKFLSIGTIFYDFFANNNLDKYRIISGNWNIKNRLEGINGTIYIPINGSYNSIFVSSRFSSENNLGQLFLDPAPENLVLYLTFDEGSGNIVYDYSGNNRIGIHYKIMRNFTNLNETSGIKTNRTHIFDFPNQDILSDVNLTVSYRNNTINGEMVRVFVNGNYIGQFNSSDRTTISFNNILRYNFTSGTINTITYEVSNTNITTSIVRYASLCERQYGIFGNSITFDGRSDYVDLPDISNGNFSRTLTAWIYPNLQSYGRMEIVNIMGTFFNLQNDGRVCIYISGANVIYNCSKIRIQPKNWSFVAVSFNGTHEMIYINGNLDSSSLVGIPNTAKYDDSIGVCSYCNWGSWFNGTIDEVRIYNRSLSEEEIKFLYEQGLKKLQNSGMINVNNFNNTKIVFSNPNGKIYVSEIIVGNLDSKEINLILPIYNVDLISNFKIGKGNYRIKIENIGFNETSKRPIIKIELE